MQNSNELPAYFGLNMHYCSTDYFEKNFTVYVYNNLTTMLFSRKKNTFLG